MSLVPNIRDGDWTGVRKAIQQISSTKLGPIASPTFASLTLSGLTASRLVSTDSINALVSSDLYSWVTQTANQVLIADDSDGTITFSTPQDIHTGATPTFAGLIFSDATYGDYKFTHDRTWELDLQNQRTGVEARLNLFSKDGDKTDDVQLGIWGDGTPASLATGENLYLGWQTSTSQYVLYTISGSGTSRPLSIFTQDNTSQLVLAIDGTSSFGSSLGLGVSPSEKFEIGSDDNSNYIKIWHNNSNALFRWDDGSLRLQSDEATTSIVQIRGAAGQFGELRAYNADNSVFFRFNCIGTTGFMDLVGGGLVSMSLQSTADTDIRMFGSAAEGETQEFVIFGRRTGDVLRSLQTGVGVDAADTVSFDGLSNYSFNGNLILPKASGKGIKVDRAAATFGWKDLLGDQFSKNTGGTKPLLTTYNDTIDAWQFSDGDEAFLTYHIPHDYVPGTDIHLHVHWSQTYDSCTGGTIDFRYSAIYAKGHNQVSGSVFGPATPITATFPSININDGNGGLNQYQHHLTEVVISAASSTGALFDRDDFEPDGVIELTFEMTSNNLTGVSVTDPFIHYVDIHYQSTNIGTKDKAPDFYV
jgi:hypothetical protein